MTSELDVDLGSIRDEELLRRMWLQTEDFGRKKQIRARMYKLREERLREFYVTGEMDSPNIGITKAPLTPSHGESISDQSFQSFKAKEIRDSVSPTHELKYTRGGVIVPDTSGWNVVTSSEVSPDGKSYKTETLASTEGTQKISGGHSQFAGKNEHLQSASHKGDDKNFVKTASEKSNTQLQEKIVVGDENNGRMEQKSSSVVSSSHVTTSKQSSYGPDAGLDHQAVLSDFDQLVDSAMPTKRTTNVHRNQQQQQEHQQRSENTVRQERQVREYQQQEERQHQQKHYQQTQNEQYVVEDNTNQQQLRNNQTRTNEANQSEQVRRKLIQEEVDLLAAAPGKIISRTVDYPDPNTKVITETKTLPDGTTVTTRKFETKSAKSKTWSSSSNQKECTSSRTIVEDRAQRNRVEYVVDGKEKVISDDYNERRITDRDTPQILRDTGRRTENKHQTKEEVFTKETTQQKQVHDRVDQKVHKTVTKEDKIFQDELRKENRQQDNIVRRTDKVQTDRAENLKDQVEVFETDTVHKTIKKDLNQTVRDAKLTNQDFIQTERGCSMVDHSRIVPEKYTTAPKTDSTETRIHVTRTQTEQQDNRGCVDVSREEFITQQQRPDHPGSPKKPSQDYTTHGFPSVRPQDSNKPQKRDQDFTTQGFPSVRSPGSHRPTQDPRYSSPDRPTSTTTQTFETQNVEQTLKSQKTEKSSEQRTVTRQSEDFTTHGFPSVSPQRASPARQPEDRQQKFPIQPDHTTQTVHETRQTVEERTVRKGKDDFTTHGFPSARPTPSERSPRQPIDKPRQTDHPDYTSETVQVQQLQQQQTRQSTDQQITRQNLVQEYSSGKPDRRSPSTPHEGSPKQPLERPKEPNQQQTVEKHFYTESRQTVVDRDQERRQSPHTEPQKPGSIPHHPDGSYPSKDAPQRYLQEPSQRYPHESTPKYPQEPGQKYPQDSNKRYPEEPGQRYPQPSGQKYPQEPYQRHPKEPTQGFPQEPAQRYPTEHTRPEYPSEKIPKGYAKQPQQPSQTTPKDVTKSTHVTEIRTTTQQVQPDQFKEPYPSTYEVVRPDQPYRPDADDASSVTTERTDISDTSRRNRKDYLNTRVTVEVDAAHDAFARSLRCVSPVDQTRGSVKSLKSVSSIRSSSSPDKRSHRSPSHESDTSKLSTSTITKTKDTRDSVRKSTSPTKKSPLKDRLSPRDKSYPKEQKDLHKPNEPADSPRTRPRKDEPSIRPSKKPEVIRSPEDTKASRYPNSVNEVSTRPGTYLSRASPKKYDSRPTPSDEFSTSPTRKGPRPSPTIQTDQPTSDNTKPSKFTKTVKVDNAILRDNTTPKRPGKPQYSDDEGFEPESPRSVSPSYPKRFEEPPKLTTDLDSTDITVQVNLKNVGRNIDLSTTITDTDSTTKNYRNEEFITREKDDTVVSNKKTTTVETTDQHPEKETHFPTETGEPFYLISTDQPKPKGGKQKPPLNRSETYEERCRQILGMDQTLKDTKKTKSTVTEDFITTERIVQEKDKVGKIPSPVPSPRSSSPRKHHTTTVTDNITITGRAPSQTPDQSPTRKSKGPDSSGYTTPKDSPSASPYSSLSRKSTPRNTPTDSPYTRSPTSSPTRKNQSTSPQRPVSRESIPKRPEFDDSETITSSRFVDKTTRETERDLTKRSSIRRSPSPSQSPTQSPERKPLRKSPRQSPERYVPSTITIESRSKEDRRSVDSTTKSMRKEPYKTEVCYEVTKPRSRSPSGSPRRSAPYESSPKRDQFSVTEKQYISNVSRTKKEEVKDTDDIRRTRITKTTKTTQVKDTPSTTRYGVSSPTRRPLQPEEPKGIPKKTTTPITSRVSTLKTPTNQRGTPVSNSTLRKPVGTVPSSSPLKTKTLPTRPAASSPSRRSPSVPESETFRRTKNEQVDTRKIASTVKTTKSSTTTKTEDQENHVTIAKIQLSPTPTRKISSPEKKIPKQPEVRIFRPTATPVTTKVTKTTVPRRDQPERTQPLRRPGPDVKKPKETETTRRRIEKQTVTVEDESDSSLIREKEEVTVIRQTREMPITIVGKTQPSKKVPVTERKESAPIYGTRTTKDTTQKMNRSTSDNVLKTSTVRETRSQYDKNINVSEDKPTRRDSTDKPHSKSERRPSKHLATKTINLSAPTGIIINSEDMENVIIDIQQAKSSREPSPNKIIPTPVPLDEYTGKPRYPDTVQEPEEEPRRKPKVKNIPIFEEETNNYVGCYITEVDETLEKRTQKRTTEVSDDETLVKTSRNQRISRESSPHKEPKYLPDGSVVDDECLLSVHDKVNKFINTAEEIKKPKTSGPFRREKPSELLPEKDDCLLSVNAKVSKFSTTAENVTKTPRKSPPKQIGRPNIDEIDEDLRTDECILSVSEKVNKFINTAEKLVSPVPQRSPELVAKVERQISRQSDESDKEVVTKTTDKSTTVSDRYTSSVGKKTVTDKPASPKSTLKSSAAIQKAKQVFENGGPTTPRQKDILSRPSVWEGRKQTTSEVRLEDIGVYKKHGKDTEEIFEKTEHTSSRSPTRNDGTYSPKPLRSTAVLKDSVTSKKDLFESRTTSKTNVTTSETTKTTRRTSDNLLESRTERRSSGDYSRYSSSKETSPNRYYPDDHSPSRYSKETETTSRRTEETIRRSGSPQSKRYSETDSSKKPSSHGRDGSPCSREHSHRSRVTTDSVSAKRNLFEKTERAPRTHSPAPAGPRPSYMDHTMSSLEHIRRDSVEVNKNYQRKTSMDSTSTHEYDGSPRSGTKFGVDLKRVDSKGEKMRRRSSSAEIPHIEEIFDLELLEQMLHTVSGYEHRRRIRSQIRIVKKMIETQNRDACHTEYIRMVNEERSSSRGSSPSPDRQHERRYSPSRKESSKTTSSRFIETESKHTSRAVKKEFKERSVSPQAKVERYETIREVKRTGEKPKTIVTKQVREEKPIWATKNILKKATQNNQPKSVATKKVTSTTTSKTQTRRQKTEAEEDSVISCYGIGPTDEDGRPLFGIRALQKRNKPSETTKVTGTVITEKYYSENGAPPVGERKVTVYSTSPDDVKKIESKLSAGPTAEMIKRERSSKDGITTVTRMEKISKTRDAEEQDIPAIMATETKDLSAKPKIVRKGSVKEITEKYIRKTSTSSIPDRSNRGDYPKAGLILRTQTHTNRSPGSGEYYVSDSGSFNDSGDESPSILQDLSTERNGTVEPVERNCSKFSSSKSFLNSSGSKVSGVNDILDKMRNADNVVEDGDTAEDKEARSLLNKFLGASILMTGMESMVPKTVVGNIGGPEIKGEEVKTSRQTKTKEDFSAPVEEKTCDFEDIWDLEVLKQLLEKSINYEERRRIRARIRQLMAEREEICTTQTTEKKEESDGAVVTTTTKVTTRTVAAPPKPISPFAKFRQLDKQQSLQSPNSPVTPTAPGGMGRGAPLFKFTDPSLNARAATAKEQLLYWCQMKTKEYENVQITNFSTSWTDGLAFCALIHHFLPDAFDYSTLTPQQRRHNFELAFRVADEKAGIAPLLDVEDMVVMKRPDWKCVFTYVQSIYRRFRNSQ